LDDQVGPGTFFAILGALIPFIIIGALVYAIAKSRKKAPKPQPAAIMETRMPEGDVVTSEPRQTLASNQKYCLACAAVLDARAEICPKCGVRQHAPPGASGTTATPSGKTRIAAALFALFLGGLGVHKFYLGQTVMGVVYLVFCWTFIPAIIGFIEGIVLLTQSDQDFAAKYG
jgi:TM2 domain-containing membrane protein YozV